MGNNQKMWHPHSAIQPYAITRRDIVEGAKRIDKPKAEVKQPKYRTTRAIDKVAKQD